MSSLFLCGLLAAWTIAQVAAGGFFCLAFALARREAEYLLFGILLLTFAITTGGMSLMYFADDAALWDQGSIISHVGSTVAVPVHLHFVMRYTRARFIKPVAICAYPVSLAYGAIRASGWWWVPDSVTIHVTETLGHRIAHVTMVPLPHAISYYVFGVSTVAVSTVLLLLAYRSGQREALVALLGSAALVVAGANDALLASGTGLATLFLLPHAFMLYAFALASSLLYRYRSATGELEVTASSLRERTAELRHSYNELSVMEIELAKQQQLAAVGELAASIAHEVRNPLAVIVNATASLRRSSLREQDRDKLLGIVDEEAARLNGLVTDLLRFARPFSASLSSVNLPELAERAGAVVGDKYQVAVSIPDDPSLTRISADPTLLRMALENLIENACQSMPEGGTISISSRQGRLDGKPCVRVEIADQGHGMKPDVQSRALDPFFTTRPSGTGLGLPIVVRIMEAHGGEVTIDSEPGAGTTIGLLLPVPEPGAAASGPPSRRPRARRQRSTPAEPKSQPAEDAE